MDHRLLQRIAAPRHGLVSLRDATKAGVSEHAFRRALRSGVLVPVHPGVGALPGSPDTRERRILAAVLANVDGTGASHRSSAYLWGAGEEEGDPVDIVVPKGRGLELDGVVVHRPRDANRRLLLAKEGIPTFSVIRTVVDLAAVVDEQRLALALDRLVVSKLVSVATLHTALRRHRRQGRPGIARLEAVLDGWAIGTKPPDSVLEPAMAALLRRHGLPTFVFHHPVRVGGRTFVLDFADPIRKVNLEVDGWETHGASRAGFERDRQRDALLRLDGWLVQRFTWFQVQEQEAFVADVIRELLAQRDAA